MSTRPQLSETINRLLPGEANKRIREAILQAANYSGSRTDQLRQSIDAANRIQTGVLINGTVEITTDTNANVAGWAWVSNFAVKQQAGSESITILAPDDDYIRADYFIGMPDGSIDYRPSTIDPLGNSMPPTVDPDEVILRIIQRNPDGTTAEVPMEQGRFPDTEFYTQADFDTTGLYAPVWRTRVQPHQSFIIQLDYGSPSDALDWSTGPSARSGRLNLAIYCQGGVAVTGILFQTIGGGSVAGDWALVRDGDELTLYHKSVAVWMRVSFRATFLAMAATTGQFLQAQTYATLPAGDQLFESTPMAGGGGGSSTFLALTDVFIAGGYTGKALRAIRINADATGLETFDLEHLPVIDLGDISGAFTIDLSTGRRFRFRLIGNSTMNHSNAKIGVDYVFEVTRESNFTLGYTASKYRFPLGYTPVLTNTTTNGSSPAKAIDLITGFCMVAGRLDIVITPDLKEN